MMPSYTLYSIERVGILAFIQLNSTSYLLKINRKNFP